MIEPGTRIGGLLIEQFLDRGAMGEVYRAQQVSLKRPVAVKRIAEHLLDNPDMVARFEREAQCIARIQHINVVAVHEFGKFADAQGHEQYLLVMELVEGGHSLKHFMHGAMDWRSASSVILQAACGLAAAAEQGVVHRDIKPDNILLNGKGVAKLTDFGMSKAVDSVGMTMGGTLLGTPAYMPPEACMGESTDHRGDIYSLGATWYHLLTGHIPFPRDNTMAMLRAHIEDTPGSILDEAPGVPEPIVDLVRRCMAKDPTKRPISAQQVANELMALVANGLHLTGTVPELITKGAKGEAPGPPTTVATLIDPDAHIATIATVVGAPGMPIDRSKAPVGSANNATVATGPNIASKVPAQHGSGGRTGMVIMILVVVAIAVVVGIVVMAKSPQTSMPSMVSQTKADSRSSPSPLPVPPTSPVTSIPTTPATGATNPGEAASVTKPPVIDLTPRVLPPTGQPVPAPVAAIGPSDQPLVGSPTPPSLSAPHPPPAPPPPPALPEEVLTLPPLPAPPTLAMETVATPVTSADDVDLAVRNFRGALRRKQALHAQAILSSIPQDTDGYRDMVHNLKRLKEQQTRMFDSMQRAVRAGEIATLISMSEDASTYPELEPAVSTSRRYVLAVSTRWQTALRRVERALDRHDLSSASALMNEVPSDPTQLPEGLRHKRAVAAAAMASARR